MRSLKKTLSTIATVAATGLAGAAALALAYAPQASGFRTRVRSALHDMRERMRRHEPEVAPAPPANEPEEAHVAAVRVEHEREHGPDGRARAAALGRKPHVATAPSDAALHPSHTRRHG